VERIDYRKRLDKNQTAIYHVTIERWYRMADKKKSKKVDPLLDGLYEVEDSMSSPVETKDPISVVDEENTEVSDGQLVYTSASGATYNLTSNGNVTQSGLKLRQNVERQKKKLEGELKEVKSQLDEIDALLVTAWDRGKRAVEGDGNLTLEVVRSFASRPKWKSIAQDLSEKLGLRWEIFEAECADAAKSPTEKVKVY